MQYPAYSDWMYDGLKIFISVFLIGKVFNLLFKKIQEKLNVKRSKIYGLIHLLSILTFAYFLHNLTSDSFSDEFGISTPSILYSGLLINLQTNMFWNLGVNGM
jgi:hypothetical protein